MSHMRFSNNVLLEQCHDRFSNNVLRIDGYAVAITRGVSASGGATDFCKGDRFHSNSSEFCIRNDGFCVGNDGSFGLNDDLNGNG